MKRIRIEPERLVNGTNPKALYYELLNSTYPELDLTPSNSIIILVQGFGDINAKDDCIVKIIKPETPWLVHSFLHNRYDLNTVIATPTFTDAELDEIYELSNSIELVDYMAVKLNLAFTPDAIWTENYGITPTGGTSGFNWRMKAVWNSLLWYGEKIVQLHSSTNVISE